MTPVEKAVERAEENFAVSKSIARSEKKKIKATVKDPALARELVDEQDKAMQHARADVSQLEVEEKRKARAEPGQD